MAVKIGLTPAIYEPVGFVSGEGVQLVEPCPEDWNSDYVKNRELLMREFSGTITFEPPKRIVACKPRKGKKCRYKMVPKNLFKMIESICGKNRK